MTRKWVVSRVGSGVATGRGGRRKLEAYATGGGRKLEAYATGGGRKLEAYATGGGRKLEAYATGGFRLGLELFKFDGYDVDDDRETV
ncbi:hypothetical protein TBK1r_18000 [Stieleria magnilauensis]|uniref:Uncharacterized protein n=1 Tax=Stieleria magnilauensis TaxID=2527963 RepID=A0ABX5XLK9_9BACT|nr:hypothetical protein TBK1r_18000 [Planctomycetes bacterium TBK1r]